MNTLLKTLWQRSPGTPGVEGNGGGVVASPKKETLTHVRRTLADQGIGSPDDAQIAAALPEGAGVDDVVWLRREFSGLGELAVPLQDPRVTDVLLNGDGRVWVDAGADLTPWPGKIGAAEARGIAVRLAAACGQRLDDAQPFFDGVLTNLPQGIAAQGLRIHAVLSPPAAGGPCISVRTLVAQRNSLGELVRDGLCGQEVAAVMRGLVVARRNLLISGGTGAGKTTLLAALLAEVARDQRIVVVEDTPELIIGHPHVVGLRSRVGNAEGAGEIGMRQLLRQALRMRPDRIVVGEVRGAEVADLLVALNTGHDGSAGTIHANDPGAIPGRLEALGAMAGMPLAAVARQAADGIDAVVHVARCGGDGTRRITDIALVRGAGAGLRVDVVWRGEPLPGWEELEALAC